MKLSGAIGNGLFSKSSSLATTILSFSMQKQKITLLIHNLWEPGKGTMKRWKGKKHKRLIIDGVERTIEIDEPIETPASDWWEMGILNANSNERLGYPAQKPEALLERIIKASSNESDVVADFFCGCGTTIAVAQKLNRKWLGADISHLAIRLIQKRLVDTYGLGISTI